MLPRIEKYRETYPFEDYIPISAVTGEGLDVFTNEVVKRMPEGPAYFPPDQVTDQPERFLAAEMIREKILVATEQEVPHSVAVSDRSLGRRQETTRYRCHHIRRALRSKGDCHRIERRDLEADRYACPSGY